MPYWLLWHISNVLRTQTRLRHISLVFLPCRFPLSLFREFIDCCRRRASIEPRARLRRSIWNVRLLHSSRLRLDAESFLCKFRGFVTCSDLFRAGLNNRRRMTSSVQFAAGWQLGHHPHVSTYPSTICMLMQARWMLQIINDAIKTRRESSRRQSTDKVERKPSIKLDLFIVLDKWHDG